jgi:outer membrane protein assembly factor BamB
LGRAASSVAGVPPQPTGGFWNAVSFDRNGDLLVAGVQLVDDRIYGLSEECSFVVAKLSRATGSVIWRQDFRDCGHDEVFYASAREQILVDQRNDVVVGRRDLRDRTFAVYKFSGETGDVAWKAVPGRFPKHGPYLHAVALDPVGNVLAAGGLGWVDTTLVVVKLDAERGTELWRASLRGDHVGDDEFNHAMALASDAAGDAVVSGVLADVAPGGGSSDYPNPRRVVFKLDGGTGAERWRAHPPVAVAGPGPSDYPPYDHGSLVVDPSGDVLSVGSSSVFKLSGADGTELWRRDLGDGALRPVAYAIAMDGRDVVAAGSSSEPLPPWEAPDTDILVAKLDGSTGTLAWRRELKGDASGAEFATALGVDSTGHVLLTGWLQDAAGVSPYYLLRQASAGDDFFVVALDGATGAERWRRVLDGAAHGADAANALAFDGTTAAAVGYVQSTETNFDPVASLFAPSGGEEMWRVESVASRSPAELRCGDASDDDGNGLVDLDDPACCLATEPLTVRKLRIRPVGPQLGLALRADFPRVRALEALRGGLTVEIGPADAATGRRLQGHLTSLAPSPRSRRRLVFEATRGDASGLERVTVRPAGRRGFVVTVEGRPTARLEPGPLPLRIAFAGSERHTYPLCVSGQSATR